MNNSGGAFNLLRPICIRLSQITFADNEASIIGNRELPSLLDELNILLEKLIEDYGSLSPKLGDYIFVPLSSMLKTCKDIPEHHVVILFGILSKLTKLCWKEPNSIDKAAFAQLFAVCTFLISPNLENTRLVGQSVEFQMTGLEMLRSFYCTAAFKQKDNTILASMAHSITILLILSENGEREVQLNALDTLGLLIDSLDDGEILSNVLPGIVSSFVKSMSKPGITTHYSIICTLLLVLKKVLSMVYNDKELVVSTNVKKGEVEIKLENPGRHRDVKWIRATSFQMKMAFEGVFPKLVRRDNAQINSALFDLCLTALECSKHSLFPCTELLITTALMCEGGDLRRLRYYQEEIGYYLRGDQFNVTTEFQETKQFVLINNALSVLDGDHLNRFKIPYLILSRVNDSMKAQIESILAVKKASPIVGTSFELTTAEPRTNQAALKLPNISKDTYENVMKTLKHLGSALNPTDLEEAVKGFLSQDYDVRKDSVQQLWIVSNLVYGHKTSSAVSFLTFANDEELACQYDILETANDYISTLSNIDKLDPIQASNVSIALFSIKQMIETMGVDFQHEILDYIYNIVECFAANDEMIKDISGDILLYLAQSFYSGSMLVLLEDNVDYLVDGISIRLDNCLFERAYMVLRVLIKFSGFDLVERLNDVMEKMFRMLEYYHGYDNLCIVLLTLFHDVSIEIRKKFISDNPNESLELQKCNRDSFSPWGMSNIDQLLDILDTQKSTLENLQDSEHLEPPEKSAEEFFKEKFEADSDDEEEDTEASSDEQIPHPQADWHSPIPRNAYHLLLRFWAYADRFLTHVSRTVRIKSLSLLILLCPLLSTEQSSFLPSVAKIWSVAVQISQTSDYFQTAKAYELLANLVKHTDSFLLSRVLEFWSMVSQNSSLIVKKLSTPSYYKSKRNTSQISKPHIPSPPIAEALLQLSKLIDLCLSQFALQIPDHVAVEMCQVVYSSHFCKENLNDFNHLNSKHVTNISIFLNREISEAHQHSTRQEPL